MKRELSEKVTKKVYKGLPTHNPSIFNNRKDCVAHFPVFNSLFKFHEDSLEIEVTDGDSKFKYYYTFPEKWSLLSKDEESITYGVNNEILVTFTHPRTSFLLTN